MSAHQAPTKRVQGAQMPHITQRHCLLLGFIFIGIIAVFGRGCTLPAPCTEGKLSPLTNDPNFARCRLNCECNNQSYEGFCRKPEGATDPNAVGVCVATKRESCPKQGERRPCLFEADRRDPQFKCPWGAQICQPEGMKLKNWGDCAPYELTKEDTQRTSQSLCTDGMDNDCDGRVDLTDPKCNGACKPGAKEPCYTGKNGLNQGICKAGNRTCDDKGQWGACEGEVIPKTTETCNGLDDNCDGNIDEGLKGCASTTICQPGDTRPCYSQTQGCQRKNDGFICRGPCRPGIQRCQTDQHWGSCEGEQYPKDKDGNPIFVERCDEKGDATAIDDNCNGIVNEGCLCQTPGATRPCYTGNATDLNRGDQAACQAGTQTCQGGQWSPCTGQILPVFESCNGKDDDCDGQIDEALPNLPCRNQKGVCRGTSSRCKAGHYPDCTPADRIANDPDYATKEDPARHCDGKDNNCNGTIDEGCECRRGDIKNCYTGTVGCTAKSDGSGYDCKGSCTAGVQFCRNGKFEATCRLQQTPTNERCDGQDNDCDGTIDEECNSGPMEPPRENTTRDGGSNDGPQGDANPCQNGAVRNCTTTLPGPCQQGTQVCRNDLWAACVSTQGVPEVCDGKDNDCDGQVDEVSDLHGQFKRCTGKEQNPNSDISTNPCFGALARCHKGQPSDPSKCTAADFRANSSDYEPTPETKCDGIDNDCNGTIDENCPQSQAFAFSHAKIIRADAKGNTYVSGSFLGTITMGSFSRSASKVGCYSGFIAKLNPAGTILWLAVADGVTIQSIAIAPNGQSMFIAGHSGSNTNVCSSVPARLGPRVYRTTDIGDLGGGGGGKHDAFVAKLSTNTGQWQWGFQYGSAEKDTATSIAVNAAGAIYILGSHEATLEFARTTLTIPANTRFPPRTPKVVKAHHDVYLLKVQDHPIKPTFSWLLQSKGKMGFYPGSLRFANNGDILISGHYGIASSIVNYHPQSPAFGAMSLPAINGTLLRGGSWDVFVARVEDKGTQGNVKWAKTLGCTHICELGTTINGNINQPFPYLNSVSQNLCVDANDQLYLTGRLQGDLNVPGKSTIKSRGQDGFVAKLSNVGTLQWAHAITGMATRTDFEDTTACLLSPSGKELYVTGHVQAPRGGPAAKLGPLPKHQRIGNGSLDAFLIGYNAATGAILNDMTYLMGGGANPNLDYGKGIAWTKDQQNKPLLMWLVTGKLRYGNAILKAKDGFGLLQMEQCGPTGPTKTAFCYR